jgi:hypothetical protein
MILKWFIIIIIIITIIIQISVTLSSGANNIVTVECSECERSDKSHCAAVGPQDNCNVPPNRAG